MLLYNTVYICISDNLSIFIYSNYRMFWLQLKGFNHMLPTIRLLAAAAVSMDKTSITPCSISLMKRFTGVARPVQDAIERTCSSLPMIAVLSFGLSMFEFMWCIRRHWSKNGFLMYFKCVWMFLNVFVYGFRLMPCTLANKGISWMPGASPVSCVMTSWQGGSDRFWVHSCDVLDRSWDVLRTQCLHHSSSLIFSCLRFNCLKNLKPSKLGHNLNILYIFGVSADTGHTGVF